MHLHTNSESVGAWVVVVSGIVWSAGSDHMLAIAKRLLRSVPNANVRPAAIERGPDSRAVSVDDRTPAPEPGRAVSGCEAIVDREW
jgi:hypothetical protein